MLFCFFFCFFRLFEATRFLEDASIAHVLSALGTLSLAALANAATSDVAEVGNKGSRQQLQALIAQQVKGTRDGVVTANSTVRMFALVNLIATIEHNMFRIGSAKVCLFPRDQVSPYFNGEFALLIFCVFFCVFFV